MVPNGNCIPEWCSTTIRRIRPFRFQVNLSANNGRDACCIVWRRCCVLYVEHAGYVERIPYALRLVILHISGEADMLCLCAIYERVARVMMVMMLMLNNQEHAPISDQKVRVTMSTKYSLPCCGNVVLLLYAAP